MSNPKIHLLEKILKDNTHSVTQPRRLVFEALAHKESQSMHEIIQQVAEQVDRVSVYRIIELYEKLGIVQRITIGWKYKLELSDIFLEHHHHLSCSRCGKIIAVKDSQRLETLISELSQAHNFHLTNHQLELQGYCQQCQM